METMLDGLAFACVIAAQFLAVRAVHAAHRVDEGGDIWAIRVSGTFAVPRAFTSSPSAAARCAGRRSSAVIRWPEALLPPRPVIIASGLVPLCEGRQTPGGKQLRIIYCGVDLHLRWVP